MLDHLKMKLRTNKIVKPKVIVTKEVKSVSKNKPTAKVAAQGKKSAAKDEEADDEEDQELEKSGGARSYRVVIALKRGARFQRRADNLLSREDLNKARVLILEFALTAKNSTPKKVFNAAMGGPLKEVAHGAVWPEKGPLSFKHTVTSVLSEMQIARAKEKRLSGAEAMFEENQELKKQVENYFVEVKNLKEEVDGLKKRIKRATSCLIEA